MPSNRAIAIFGATGDLALRMLYPSLYFLEGDGLLPDGLAIIGCARSKLADAEFAARAETAVRERAGKDFSQSLWSRFKARIAYRAVDAGAPDSFAALKALLPPGTETIFYYSTSPDFYAAISANLKASGLVNDSCRVIVEKPIGHDLQSCNAINDALGAVFAENRIFRIDHYLGKEAVQNLLALRFANVLFEPIWNAVSVEHVQITVAETVGVEGRFGYYDHYGAIRDMLQNHMLQLLCLVAMEPPSSLDPDSVRNEKVKVLRSLRPIGAREARDRTVRGQYRAGIADGKSVPGYAEEADGKPSDTESFVAIAANIDNWRWAGVPFYLRTGKRLAQRMSEIVIQFRCVPHSIFGNAELVPNRMVIQLQPEESISLRVMNKTPSLDHGGMQLAPLELNLSLDKFYTSDKPRRRIAYERLLIEALKNDATLFVRRDETEAAWAWVDAIIEAWKKSGMRPAPYAAGSWGPADAFSLIARDGHSWHE